MKKITLETNGTFEHQWLSGIHTIPEAAIDVSDDDFMLLSQNPQSKALVAGVVVDYSPPFVLATAKSAKEQAVRDAFAMAAALPVTDGNSITWDGGYDSALKMDAAKRMAQLAGITTVSLFDEHNVEHVLTIAEAEVVILTVGADYQTKFAQKQAVMVAVEAALDQTSLDALVVSF